MDILLKIKRLVLEDKIIFTDKARSEMGIDAITEVDVKAAIVQSTQILKTV